MWDTPQTELMKQFSYSKTDLFCLCFSVEDHYLFHDVKYIWVNEILHLGLHNIGIILVGMKIDLRVDEKTINSLNSSGINSITYEEG